MDSIAGFVRLIKVYCSGMGIWMSKMWFLPTWHACPASGRRHPSFNSWVHNITSMRHRLFATDKIPSQVFFTKILLEYLAKMNVDMRKEGFTGGMDKIWQQ